ncbi:MAG TPA: protein-L-isoaspartate(D-aspartate) O-methyltransferase [Hyphomicrobiaceae bacterium]|jgi:protein-L-isoaspartate(D-aspartate) O-methyltransferase|nr:protein-L-isoaspartate(D-aspartate) O-methyltransferase [Hyphomicrobiaceae bacterium]
MRPGLIAILVLCVSAISAVAADDRADERRRMVETIEAHAGSPEGGLAGGHIDAPVLEAMRAVPRHEFVPAEVSGQAYADRSLPIGLGQTVSQPYIVALMTHLLEVKPGDRILEIGTGSGYQAAVLARLAGEVYSVEIVEELARRAAQTLERLGYTNITARIGDGYQGWAEHAPYDGIVVTAAPDHVPPALVAQLKPGGRLVIPVGGLFQDLMVIAKAADGTTTSTTIVPVRFVPLVRGGQ